MFVCGIKIWLLEHLKGMAHCKEQMKLHEWIFCSTACLTVPESGNEHEDCFAIVSSFTSKTILFDCSLSPSKKE